VNSLLNARCGDVYELGNLRFEVARRWLEMLVRIRVTLSAALSKSGPQIMKHAPVRTFVLGAAFGKMGLSPLAAFAHRKNWVAAPSVRFLQVAQFSLRSQRTTTPRPYCQNVLAAASINVGSVAAVRCGMNQGPRWRHPAVFNLWVLTLGQTGTCSKSS
jgi:hypothetical protein